MTQKERREGGIRSSWTVTTCWILQHLKRRDLYIGGVFDGGGKLGKVCKNTHVMLSQLNYYLTYSTYRQPGVHPLKFPYTSVSPTQNVTA